MGSYREENIKDMNTTVEDEVTQLVFNPSIAMTKPNSIRNKGTKCPFCDRNSLSGIIAEEGPILLLKNKYPTLLEASQTVLIETEECLSELSEYDRAHLEKLFHFALFHWKGMRESGNFKSVLLFKNHGPMSGGSLRHPHMQIVGLEKVDYRKDVVKEDFEGILIDEKDGVEFILSTKPKMGFTELNVITKMGEGTEQVAAFVQIATRFILSGHLPICESYNIFFYELEDKMAVKIIPRYLTSPYFVGYSIPQIWIGIEEIAEHIRVNYC